MVQNHGGGGGNEVRSCIVIPPVLKKARQSHKAAMLLGIAHPGIEANKDDRHVPRSQDAPVHGGSAVAPHVHNDSDIQGQW